MITKDINLAIQTLQKGELVAIPTETVYGLAANALDKTAVAKIYELKKRPIDHPLIVHVHHIEQAKELTTEFPEKALKLAQSFWPGPLTFVLPKSKKVPSLTTGGLQSVAIRCPSHPIAKEVIQKTGFPLAAPSANPFGAISPTTALHVEESFGSLAPLILDGGSSRVGVESTIVGFLDETPTLLRAGGVTLAQIESVIGPIQVAASNAKSIAPGMLEKHYAPRTTLYFIEASESLPELKGKVGVLCLSTPRDAYDFKGIEKLSPSGDLREAASNLYSSLRNLDSLSLDSIIAYACPNEGLGLAINDRLRRASFKKS